MKTVYLDKWGPLIRYGKGTLEIEDLNPAIAIRWEVSRTTAIMIALRLLMAALRR